MKILHNLLIILVLSSTSMISGNCQEKNELYLRSFQATVFPPISTNGKEAAECVNKISLNLFWGSHAGLLGVEFGGIMNFESEFVSGAQFAGFANFNKGDLVGLSCSGFMNTASSVEGVQLTHFLNIADEVRGAQVSNFMNIAHTVKGVQVGFINIADNYEAGVPLGIINIIKNGYRAWEISSTEFWNLSAGYRMGIDKFYTQLLVGANWKNDNDFLGVGFGIGTRFSLIKRIKGSFDLISYQVMVPGEKRKMDLQMGSRQNPRMNPMMGMGMHDRQRPVMLEQVRFTVDGKILKHLRWFAGPTLNLLVAPYRYPEFDYTSQMGRKMLYSKTSGINSVNMWTGFSAGIRF